MTTCSPFRRPRCWSHTTRPTRRGALPSMSTTARCAASRSRPCVAQTAPKFRGRRSSRRCRAAFMRALMASSVDRWQIMPTRLPPRSDVTSRVATRIPASRASRMCRWGRSTARCRRGRRHCRTGIRCRRPSGTLRTSTAAPNSCGSSCTSTCRTQACRSSSSSGSMRRPTKWRVMKSRRLRWCTNATLEERRPCARPCRLARTRCTAPRWPRGERCTWVPLPPQSGPLFARTWLSTESTPPLAACPSSTLERCSRSSFRRPLSGTARSRARQTTPSRTTPSQRHTRRCTLTTARCSRSPYSPEPGWRMRRPVAPVNS
mmetsp:Transcript_7676/g.27307  ORF Transcript_7676/g.27307 Transcript_7676/m.27307 type:complete len:318 (-) Transcript_7676:104-1057(-)